MPTALGAVEALPRSNGICRTPWWGLAEEGTRHALAEAQRLFAPHVPVDVIDLDGFAEGADLHALIMGFESAEALAWEHAAARHQMSPQVLDLVTKGRDTLFDDYRAAQARARALRKSAEALFERYDLLLAPAAPGEAPLGLGATGNPIFSRLWTLLRLPSITLPGLIGPKDLPVGVQLIARLDDDERLIAFARWAEKVLPPRPSPGCRSTAINDVGASSQSRPVRRTFCRAIQAHRTVPLKLASSGLIVDRNEIGTAGIMVHAHGASARWGL